MFRLSLKAHAQRLANRLIGYNHAHMATSTFYGDFIVRYWAPYTKDPKKILAITKYSIEGPQLYNANEKHKKITAAMDFALEERKQTFETYKKELKREVDLFSMLSGIDSSNEAAVSQLLQTLKQIGIAADDIEMLDSLLRSMADLKEVINALAMVLTGKPITISEDALLRLRHQYRDFDKIMASYLFGEKIHKELEKINKSAVIDSSEIDARNSHKRLKAIMNELLQSAHTNDEALAEDFKKIKMFNEEYKNQAKSTVVESLKRIANKLVAPALDLKQKSIIIPLIAIKNKIRSQISTLKNQSLIELTNDIYLHHPDVRISGSLAEADHDKEDIHDYLLDKAAYEISDEKSERGALRSYHHQFMQPIAQISMPTFSETVGYKRLLNPFCLIDFATDMTVGNVAYGWTWMVNGVVHNLSDAVQWCCDSSESYRYSTFPNMVKGVLNIPAMPFMLAELITYSCAVVTNSCDGFHQLCECCCCSPSCCRSEAIEEIEQKPENSECKTLAQRKSSERSSKAKATKVESEFEFLQSQIAGQIQSEAARMLDVTATRFKEETKIQKNEKKSTLRRFHSMNHIQELLATSPMERKESKSTIRELREEIPGSVSVDIEEQKSKPEVKSPYKVEAARLKRSQSACDLTLPPRLIPNIEPGQSVMKAFRRRRLMSKAYHSIRKQTSEARLSISPAQTPTAKSQSKRLPFNSTVVRASEIKSLPHEAQSSNGIPMAAVSSSVWGNSAPARLLKINSEHDIGKIADGSLYKNPTSPKG